VNFCVLTAVIGVGKKTKETEKKKPAALLAGKAKVTTTGKQPCRLYGDLVTLRGWARIGCDLASAFGSMNIAKQCRYVESPLWVVVVLVTRLKLTLLESLNIF
jgi:hypothetical protein